MLFGNTGSTLLARAGGTFGMPEQASTVAAPVDAVFNVILWISLFFFVLILGVMVIFILRYRQRDHGEVPEDSPSHSNLLEFIWSIIPVALVVVIFVMGFKSFLGLYVMPSDAYEVSVRAQKWSWSFTYPNGYTDSELHVPVNRPIRLVMASDDVLHAFFVPEFRVKRDVVPGRYTKVWFEATRDGEFPIYCAEYCGTGHSDMLSRVIVHPAGEFEPWLASAGDVLGSLPPAEAGASLFTSLGCIACHRIDGTKLVGPSLKDVFGSERTLKGGGSVTADEDYIRRSLLEPTVEVSEGFEPVMPTFQGRVSDDEIGYIIEYIKTLSE